MCVRVRVFLSAALWVSEWNICPSPLPELAKRDLISTPETEI